MSYQKLLLVLMLLLGMAVLSVSEDIGFGGSISPTVTKQQQQRMEREQIEKQEAEDRRNQAKQDKLLRNRQRNREATNRQIDPQELQRIDQEMIRGRGKINKDQLGSQFDNDPLQDQIINRQQVKDEQEIIQQEEKKLAPWLIDQFRDYKLQQNILTEEYFAFPLKSGAETTFKYSLSKKGNFHFIVNIYELESNKDLVIPQDPEQDQFVSVAIKSDISRGFQDLGHVYITKTFETEIYTEYQLFKFKNEDNQKKIVEVKLQSITATLQEGVRDDVFGISSQKSKVLLKELKESQRKQEKLFKASWGFRDREQRHQSQMLTVTAIELIVIFGTAIMQIVCIKRLMDNRIIV